MIHLFKKVYLDYDDVIDLNYDRVVIGRNGVDVAVGLQQLTEGVLLHHSKNFPKNLASILDIVNEYSKTSDKKVIIYCDPKNHDKLMGTWFKSIFPNITENKFNDLVKLTKYKERMVSYSQMRTRTPVGVEDALSNDTIDFGSIKAVDLSDLDVTFSYEYMLADYFSGSTNYVDELNQTVHTFLLRWFKELFTDSREMVLFNVCNKSFQDAFNFTESDVDFEGSNPLAYVSGLEYYADDEIWNLTDPKAYGNIQLQGLSQEKIDGLRDLIIKTYSDVEGMEVDQHVFSVFDFLEYAAAETMTNDQMDEVLDFVVENPFDTSLVPKFDFENINYVFLHHVLNSKRTGEDLSAYQLI